MKKEPSNDQRSLTPELQALNGKTNILKILAGKLSFEQLNSNQTIIIVIIIMLNLLTFVTVMFGITTSATLIAVIIFDMLFVTAVFIVKEAKSTNKSDDPPKRKLN